MSHTTTQKALCTNEIVLRQTCQRVEAEYLGLKAHDLFSERKHGYGVKLKGWQYPVIFTEAGECHFDNYNGAWGKERELSRFKQLYPIEATKLAYAGQGVITEEVLANGDIKCVVTIGGGTQTSGESAPVLGPGGIALG